VGQGQAGVLERGGATDVVRAAGGIVIRWGPRGRQVAVVHRPDRADWSYPKGKLEPGETFEEGALREVEEETGLRCRLGRFIGHTEYQDRKDRAKIVAYFEMEPIGGDFLASEEVDQMRWIDLGDAGRLLTYERDRELLKSIALEGSYPTD
jgi:8-oxo-dGTP diphosphatase